jgi:hypothetical protein
MVSLQLLGLTGTKKPARRTGRAGGIKTFQKSGSKNPTEIYGGLRAHFG